jgi:hypothetical protein
MTREATVRSHVSPAFGAAGRVFAHAVATYQKLVGGGAAAPAGAEGPGMLNLVKSPREGRPQNWPIGRLPRVLIATEPKTVGSNSRIFSPQTVAGSFR